MKLYYCIVLALVLIAGGCEMKNQDAEKKNADLQNQTKQLQQELTSRDEYIENITQVVNGVYNDLETVRAKERLVLRETNDMEAKGKKNSRQVRENLLNEISIIDSNLQDNKKTIAGLQTKINSYKTQYVGLKTMVANLKKTVEERELAIADLQQRVGGLETQLSEKNRLVSERDSVIQQQHGVISDQHTKLTTSFYVIGTRSELEDKGIIKKEGGFFWGLLGSTTILANGFDTRYFNPLNKFEDTTIRIIGKIEEIVPKRNESFYRKTQIDRNQSMISIAEPRNFWQDNYLVIITD